MQNQEAYRQAKKRLQLKLGFRTHLAIYLGVILLLLTVNLNTTNDYLWVLWPILGWGVGIFYHGLNAYVFPDKTRITDEMVRKEMKKTGNQKAK